MYFVGLTPISLLQDLTPLIAQYKENVQRRYNPLKCNTGILSQPLAASVLTGNMI